MEAEVFPDLRIADSSFLKTINGRAPCTKCGKSRKYYCYTCCLPIPGTEAQTPRVKLPLLVDVIKHPQEVDGKSTAIQAATLAPDHITIYTYPTIPHYDTGKVVLVFPGDKAMTLEAFAEAHRKTTSRNSECYNTENPSTNSEENLRKRPNEENENATNAETLEKSESELKRTKLHDENDCKEDASIEGETQENRETSRSKQMENFSPDVSVNSANIAKNFVVKAPRTDTTTEDSSADASRKELEKICEDSGIERVVFIDSTWHQVHKIATDERLKALPKIELKSRTTHFWRHQQGKPDTYLATVEAIYYFCLDFHHLFLPHLPYTGQYDNLLFYFKFMYGTIRDMYDGTRVIRAYNKDFMPKGNQKGKGKRKGKKESDESIEGKDTDT